MGLFDDVMSKAKGASVSAKQLQEKRLKSAQMRARAESTRDRDTLVNNDGVMAYNGGLIDAPQHTWVMDEDEKDRFTRYMNGVAAQNPPPVGQVGARPKLVDGTADLAAAKVADAAEFARSAVPPGPSPMSAAAEWGGHAAARGAAGAAGAAARQRYAGPGGDAVDAAGGAAGGAAINAEKLAAIREALARAAMRNGKPRRGIPGATSGGFVPPMASQATPPLNLGGFLGNAVGASRGGRGGYRKGR